VTEGCRDIYKRAALRLLKNDIATGSAAELLTCAPEPPAPLR
jgi:hypothetical protein